VLICLLIGGFFFIRRRRRLQLEQDALDMSVVDPTPRNSRLSVFSWMRRSTHEPTFDTESGHADPFSDDMKVVDLNEKTPIGRGPNPFTDQNSRGIPPSFKLVAGRQM